MYITVYKNLALSLLLMTLVFLVGINRTESLVRTLLYSYTISPVSYIYYQITLNYV